MKVPRGKPTYPISAAQRLLRWSELFSIEPRKVRENNIISFYMRVSAGCDGPALERAYNELIKNNDALRLRLYRTRNGIRQYIREHAYTALESVEVDGEPGFRAFLSGIKRVPVTFFSENLVWARLVRLAPGDCALVMRVHHAAIDGYSIRLVFERLEKYYDCFRNGETPAEEKNRSILQYFDLQDRYARSGQHKDDRKFWFRQYNRQRRYSFPAGYRSERGDCASETMAVGGETYRQLKALADRMHCTLQFLLMALAAVTTYAATGRENFCIFSLTHGRINHALKDTIGCMMNTVPVFFDLSPDSAIQAMLPGCYMAYLDTLAHGRLPMGEQVPMSYPEAVKHFFNFNHGWLLFSCMEYGGLFARSRYEMKMINPTNQAHQFYLTMLEVTGDRVDFELSYQTHKFKAETVRKLLRAYAAVIHIAVTCPQFRIGDIREFIIKGESAHDNAAGDIGLHAGRAGAGPIGNG